MMQETRKIINRFKVTHELFEYYEMIIEKIENNVTQNPDISIESSKSLIEGISKTIWKKLDTTATKSSLDSLSVSRLVSSACEKIDEQISIEIDFPKRASSLVQRMGEIRNDRGDISHGKLVPKESISSSATAKMIMLVTDSIVSYILKAFFSIDLSYKEETKYNDNPEFNDFIDENYPIELISYSKALFDQYPVDYENQLQDYLLSMEEE